VRPLGAVNINMQICAHGIDLVDCSRIANLLERHPERFVRRVYTSAEQAYAGKGKNKAERFSGRFAAKEAIMKLIGTGWRDTISWTDIEVVNDPLGKPMVKLSGRVQEIAEALGIRHISLSITHAAGLAIASAVALTESPVESHEA
jgi:holo-[acyl-carrier protein] synthase